MLRKINVYDGPKKEKLSYTGSFHGFSTDADGEVIAIVENDAGDVDTVWYGFVRFVKQQRIGD